MAWIDRRFIYRPVNREFTHAANPFPIRMDDQRLRVFFSSRDSQQRSHVRWIDVAPDDGFRIVDQSAGPILEPGSVGLFDDSGVSLGSVLIQNEKIHLYYVGWNLGVTVPWRNSIGLATGSFSELTLSKTSRAPIVDRSEVDPYSLSYPFVLRQGDEWMMWYGSNETWGTTPKDMIHVIKFASSKDGIQWTRKGEVCVAPQSPEWAVSRPFVLKENERYVMWCSARANRYRIACFESYDGIKWLPRSERDLGPGSQPWENEEVSYPAAFYWREKLYLLYCGNQYGRDGFGVTQWEK